MGVIYCCIWWINCFFCFFIIWNINNLKRNNMKETIEEASERTYSDKLYPMYGGLRRDAFIKGAKCQQEKICDSEVIQRIRASKSDAEARRIIRTI